MAKKCNALGYVEYSAKTGENMDVLMKMIGDTTMMVPSPVTHHGCISQ